MASLLLSPGFQITDDNGCVQSGAKLYIYDAGTTTAATTYSDVGLTTAQTHPVVADSAGRHVNIYVPGGQLYKIAFYNSSDVLIWERDDIPPAISSGDGALPIAQGGSSAITAPLALVALGAASDADLTTLNGTVSTLNTAQTTAAWETGTSTVEGKVSPEKVAAAIAEQQASQSGVPDAEIWDEKTSGTVGDSLTGDTWTTRTVNTKRDPNTLVTLSSNTMEFTKAGFIRCFVPVGNPGTDSTRNFRAGVYNVTDSVMVNEGMSMNASRGEAGFSIVTAVVETGKQYSVQTIATSGSNGGEATSLGTAEIYSMVEYYSNHNT